MRARLEIDEDVMEVVRRMVELAADTAPLVELREGIPVWVHGPGAVPVTSEMVGELAEG